MGIKEKFARKRLSGTAAAIKRTPEIPNLETVKKVGVIWQPEQKEAFHFLQNYFNKRQVVFRHLCIYSENIELAAELNAIIPKDLDWLGFPKPGKVDNFVTMNFDILLNIATKQNVTLDYLTLVTQAKFKVGGQTKMKNFFDLNINIGQNQDALYLAEQQIFYLGQLNNKTNK
jgi:hypothetical protein